MFKRDFEREPQKTKLVTVGDGYCGKTSLLMRYETGEFNENYCATIFENSSIEIEVANQKVELLLFDTAGQEGYESLRPLSYFNTDVVLLCYSIDNPHSLENIESQWDPEINHFSPGASKVLVGTKKDLRDDPDTIEKLNSEENPKHPVEFAYAKTISEKIKAKAYMECSAKTNEGVKELFQTATSIALENKANFRKSYIRKSLSKGENLQGSSGECQII